MARLAPVLVTLMVGATGCGSDDDIPDEPTEQIDEGDPDQIEDDLEDEADQSTTGRRPLVSGAGVDHDEGDPTDGVGTTRNPRRRS